MKEQRAFATGGVLDNQLYVVGGYNGESALSVCEFYDPAEDLWSECPELLEPRTTAGSAVLGNRLLYVIGGGPTGEVFETQKNAWQEIEMPMLETGEIWLNLGVANVETRIYAQGGRLNNKLSPDNYLYVPLIYRTYLPTVRDQG
jgi:hypothetical protein